MNRYAPYLGGALAVAVGFLALVTLDARPRETPSPPTPPLELGIASSSDRASVPVVEVPPAKQDSEPRPAPQQELASAAARLREALVNIWCASESDGIRHSVSGSGVLIDPKGYVLTNAHVAQYLLLAERGVVCVVRSGSPASGAYRAELAYISPAWIKQNAHTIVERSPVGTGEHDVAILALSSSSLQTWPSVRLASRVPVPEVPVAVVSYAAQYLTESEIARSLFPTIVLSRVAEVLTFGTNAADVLSFSGSIAAQEGASGGGVVIASGELVGVVTTSNVQGPLDERSITAITADYVRREYAEQADQSLDTLLATPPATAVAQFAPQAAELQQELEKILDSE